MDRSNARRDSIGNDSNVNRNEWFTEQMPIRMPPVFSRANHNNRYRLKLLNILFSMSYTARGRFPSFPWPTMRHSRKTKSTLHSHDFTFETDAQSPLGAVLRYTFTTERVLSLNTRSPDSHLSLLSSNHAVHYGKQKWTMGSSGQNEITDKFASPRLSVQRETREEIIFTSILTFYVQI